MTANPQLTSGPINGEGQGQVKKGRKPPLMKDGVSIVIVTFNELRATKRCLKSIRACTSGDHEVIVVDNASTDGTRKYLKRAGVKKNILNTENLGFAKGVNQGARLSEGKYLMLLNNDTVVTEGWLDKMVDCLESDPNIGLAGPLTNDFLAGSQSFKPAWLSYVDYDYFRENYGPHFRGHHVPLFHIGRYRNESELKQFAREFFPIAKSLSYHELKSITGFCVLMRRTWFNQLGCLDERFQNGAEDHDLNIRTLLAGKKIVVVENVFVHHDAGRSFWGAGIDRTSHCPENAERLREKWEKVPGAKEILKDFLL